MFVHLLSVGNQLPGSSGGNSQPRFTEAPTCKRHKFKPGEAVCAKGKAEEPKLTQAKIDISFNYLRFREEAFLTFIIRIITSTLTFCPHSQN